MAFVRGRLVALLQDEVGQDLAEYALLAAAIALASIAVFSSIRDALGSLYRTWLGNANTIAAIDHEPF